MEGPTVSAHISRIIVLGLGYLACKKHRDGVGIKVVLGASGGSRFYFDSSQQAMPTMTPFYPYLSLYSRRTAAQTGSGSTSWRRKRGWRCKSFVSYFSPFREFHLPSLSVPREKSSSGLGDNASILVPCFIIHPPWSCSARSLMEFSDGYLDLSSH